jgi:hypothetical protein
MSMRSFRSSRSFLFVLALGAGACSATTERSGFHQNGDPNGQQPDDGFGNNPPPTNENEDGCAEEAKLVYVMTLEGDLYSFAPAQKKFTKVGPLDCQSAGGQQLVPISMAVARDAVAWVHMRAPGSTTSELYKVDTKTAACTPSGIRGQMGGMGFSINEGTKDQETLFLIGAGSGPLSPGLNRVNFAGKKLEVVADLPELTDLELTGTGDGRLYGFLMNDPLELAKVNKTSSAFSERVSLAQIAPPRAPMFAFSFWGGDFYFYTAQDPSPSLTTTVHKYDTATKKVETYMTNIGFHIVGAGVSTCAPVSAPK